MLAFVFPGQGSQKTGMGAELIASAAGAAQFAAASELLGVDLARLCLEGPDASLTDTRVAQPALLVVGALYALAARERGLTPAFAAGHSLGEYTALVSAGVLSLTDALSLVKRRAELMAAAPAGTMAALIGLADDALPGVLQEAGAQGMVVAANFNSPGQVVISGERAAVEAAMQGAREKGAKMVVALPVSGAFHSPLMNEAGAEMAALIDEAAFRPAGFPVYQNSTAAPATAPADLKAALKLQMTGAVRWSETISAMVGAGADAFVELGPGKVLSGLIKRIDKTVATDNAENWGTP